MPAPTFQYSLTQRVYDYIRDYVAEHHYGPTLREIGAGCYVAHTTVITHLAKLEAKGWITREFGKSRSIALGEYAPDYRRLHPHAVNE